jgi:hypothetical protein
MASASSRALSNALAFAANCFAVLPLHSVTEIGGRLCCTCGDGMCTSTGKHPFSRFVPHGLKDATSDVDLVRSWFAEHDWLNYGVCTDMLPTVDIDPRNGGDKAWLDLVRKNYDVHTWRVKTGGDGQHIIFGTGETPISSGKVVRGVDVKGIGGYIVGAGSRHISGQHYAWYRDANPNNTELQAMPPWLVGKLARPKQGFTTRTPEYFNELIAPALNGERHDKVAALLGHLFGSQFPNRGILLALVISHVRLTYPDLEGFGDNEVISIARDLARAEARKREAA